MTTLLPSVDVENLYLQHKSNVSVQVPVQDKDTVSTESTSIHTINNYPVSPYPLVKNNNSDSDNQQYSNGFSVTQLKNIPTCHAVQKIATKHPPLIRNDNTEVGTYPTDANMESVENQSPSGCIS